ncbi:MAG TPA: exopolysaccharide biosynthesis polyprenyl glycosylphosphotransferase [Longimicrobiales bacterium]|nr:exopolysaccharide biosynthesis polyprenyl glycosylphosphotransferase [Longimicrobiales bacterium]
MSVFVHDTEVSTLRPAEQPDVAALASALVRPAVENGAARPADVRAEREAAVHLLLRLTTGALVRVAALLVVDLGALAAAAALTLLATGSFGADSLADLAGVGAVTAYGVLLGIAANGAYGPGDPRRDPARLTRGVLIGMAASLLLTRLLGGTPAPVAEFALLGAFSVLLVVAGRLATDAVTRLVSPAFMRRHVLLIGDEASARAVLAHFNGSVSTRMRVAGRLVPSRRDDPRADGELGDLKAFLRDRSVDVVVVASALPDPALRDVVHTAFRRGVHVELVPTAVRDSEWVIRPQVFFGCPVLEVRPSRLGVPQLALKRAFDLVFASMVTLALLPLFLLVALAIRLDSRGPVIFRQVRAGLGGRPFTILKFRTMVFDADDCKETYSHLNESDVRLFKIPRDPRVTRVGRVLRALSLDELPQLLNIIRGEMSFVGPRPFVIEDLQLYEPHHFERLTVLPGLTGLWQVSGRSEIKDWERVVRLDQEYIRTWSLLLDFRIMLKTLPALARRHGAF